MFLRTCHGTKDPGTNIDIDIIDESPFLLVGMQIIKSELSLG